MSESAIDPTFYRTPAEAAAAPREGLAYVVAFVVHWSLLLSLVAIRLWRAGRGEASVARKRMHMLAFASTSLLSSQTGIASRWRSGSSS